MLPLVLAGAGVQAAGGLIGYFVGRGERKKAEALQREAIARYGEASEEAINSVALEMLGPTELQNIQLDPAYKAAQLNALDTLQDMGENGGRTLADDANLNRLNSDLARQENASRARLQDEMATRGIGGGGTELAMLRASGQDRLARQSQATQDTAARAEQRAFDAIMGAGQLGGQMRGQEYAEKSDAAKAADAIARYNTGAKNGLSQWQADQRLGVAGNLYSGQMKMGDQARANAQDTRQTIAGVGSGIGQGMIGAGVYGAKGTGTVKPAVQTSTASAVGPYANKYQAEDYNPYDDDALWGGS